MAKGRAKKISVGVLMGGLSSEHDVSLMTGNNVMDNLDRNKYEPVGVRINKNKEWFVRGVKMSEARALADFDVIFNALHGEFGEDGKVQALLEYHGKQYTGSGVAASALAMDKLRSREIFKMAGLMTPKTLEIKKGENYQAVVNLFAGKIVNFPVVVKPRSNGSSFGVKIVDNKEDLNKAIMAAFKIENRVLVEEFLRGREFTCGVLENNGIPEALPVTEIIPKSGHAFFDYNAKYKIGHADELTPANLSEDTTLKVKDTAIKTHQLLGCKAYSRTDFILSDGALYVLELNTLPGLTEASLLPKAAKANGLTFAELLIRIIDASLV